MTNGEAASFPSASLASRSGFLQHPRHQKPETGQHISKKSWQIDLRQNPLKNPCFFDKWRRKVWFFPADPQYIRHHRVWFCADRKVTRIPDSTAPYSALLPQNHLQLAPRHAADITAGFFFQVSFLKHKLFLPIKPKPQQDVCLSCQFLSTSFAFLLLAI